MSMKIATLDQLRCGEVVKAIRVFDNRAEDWGIVMENPQGQRGVLFFQHSEDTNAHAIVNYTGKVLGTGCSLNVVADQSGVSFARSVPNTEDRTSQKLVVVGSDVAFFVLSRLANDQIGAYDNIFVRLDGTSLSLDDVPHDDRVHVGQIGEWRWEFAQAPRVTLEPRQTD